MENNRAANQQASVLALKARYAAVFRKQSPAKLSERKAPSDEAAVKRAVAARREREFFLERLRFLLKDAGVSRREIAVLEKGVL